MKNIKNPIHNYCIPSIFDKEFNVLCIDVSDDIFLHSSNGIIIEKRFRFTRQIINKINYGKYT